MKGSFQSEVWKARDRVSNCLVYSVSTCFVRAGEASAYLFRPPQHSSGPGTTSIPPFFPKAMSHHALDPGGSSGKWEPSAKLVRLARALGLDSEYLLRQIACRGPELRNSEAEELTAPQSSFQKAPKSSREDMRSF